MKKLLSFILAGAALFGSLGLASCSGNLHDSKVEALYVEGDMCSKVGNETKRGVFTKLSETEQEFTFNYATSMTAWGGKSGTVNFKIVLDETGWDQDWGWEKDISKQLTINSDEWLETKPRDAANSNPGNLVIKDLQAGESYTIKVQYDAPTKDVKVKVTGNVTDYPALLVVVGDDSYPMTRSGSTYTYLYEPEKEGSFDYYITNGYLYWAADGKMVTQKPTSGLAKLEYKYETWTNDGEVKKYYIEAATEFPSKTDITLSTGLYNPTVLGKSAFVGNVPGFNWNGDVLVRDSIVDPDDYSTYEFEFVAQQEEYMFSIQEIAGSWDTRWCGQDASDTDEEGNYVKDNPVTIAGPTTDGAVTADKTLTYISGGNPAHVILNVSNGYKYKLIVKVTNSGSVSASLKLIEAGAAKLVALDGFGLRGLFNNWDITDSNKLNKQDDGTYTCEFVATAAESEAKIANSDWFTSSCGWT